MMGLHQIPFFNFMFIPSKHTFTKSKLWSESWTLSSKWAKCFFELVIIFKECFWTTRCWKKASWCDIYPTYTTTAVIVAFQTLPFSQIQLLNAMPSWDNFFHQAKKKKEARSQHYSCISALVFMFYQITPLGWVVCNTREYQNKAKVLILSGFRNIARLWNLRVAYSRVPNNRVVRIKCERGKFGKIMKSCSCFKTEKTDLGVR